MDLNTTHKFTLQISWFVREKFYHVANKNNEHGKKKRARERESMINRQLQAIKYFLKSVVEEIY